LGIDRSDDLERGEVERASGVDGVRRVGNERGEAGDRTDEGNLAEAGDRGEYYTSLQEAAWGEAVERFRAGWDEHRKRWPDEEREPVDRSADPPGSWRGDSNRYLDGAANAEVDARYERIADVERNVVSPAMREIESCDSSRTLVGWEYRLKSADRLKDKVAEGVKERGRTVPDAVMLVPDALRYTFQYDEASYTQGVRGDIAQIKEHGFELVRLKNYWSGGQYKGINSQWMDPDSGQRFEVQFHTRMSFEGKQLTHGVYECLRGERIGAQEEGELETLQGRLVEGVPVPSGADEIEEVRRDGR
jgi:hypothetical protein